MPPNPKMAIHSGRPHMVLCVVLGLLLQLCAPNIAAAPPGSVATNQAVLPVATASQAASIPVVAQPVTSRASVGSCVINVQTSYQCGGNQSNPVATCQDFNSCSNTAWTGACCPSGATCQQARPDLPICWTCGGTLPSYLAATPPPNMCTGTKNEDFDYPCVLGASLLFYEAQRSGRLPADNRIPWRGDSGLADKDPKGNPLVGGYYDAGDVTKFTFPAAWTLSNLALTYLEFKDAVAAAGQAQHMLKALKWGADYLLKLRFADGALIVGSWAPGATIEASHWTWGRPEDISAAARLLVLNGTMKGADVLGQAAAALAATSMAFQDSDPTYASGLVDVARSLYEQAANRQGLYSDAFPQVQPYYRSYNYLDDLTWAAAWLAYATKDADYVEQAKFFWKRHQDEEGGGEGRRYDYNNMIQAMGYIMAKIDPQSLDVYLQPIRSTMDLWLTAKSNITYSPKGLAWIDSWGNLRYVSNQAFMGLLHAKAYPKDTKRNLVYTCFARKQMRYILGDSGRSYVVGVGSNPPCQPHHRGASCGPLTQFCDCGAFANKACNPNVVYGGLVGGPGKDDSYTDDRLNFAANEVALDWNAGFTGVMAALSSDAYPSWRECAVAGQQQGRGQAAPSLNTAGLPAGGAAQGLWVPLLVLLLGSWLWL